MKQRILSILMTLCLCLTLLPTAARAVTGTALTVSHSGQTLSGGTAEAPAAYYLSGDVTLTGTITVTGTVTLDLNGYTLSGKKGADATGDDENGGTGGTAITVQNGGKLTITDGSTTGSIVGGNGGNGNAEAPNGNGGSGGSAITVKTGGSLTVSSGKIKGGNGSYSNYGGGSSGGAAVTVEGGSLTVSSGEIVGGNGGNGGNAGSLVLNGNGGSGGSGIEITGGSGIEITGGEIKGGNGGNGVFADSGSGGSSGGSGGAGGNGLSVIGGSVTVGGSGTITGGNGGKGGDGDGTGGAGGNGLSVIGGSVTVDGSGTITGGTGGTGGDKASSGANGGNGGSGLSVSDGSVSLDGGKFHGANGGNGANGTFTGGNGGNGGSGLSVTGGSVSVSGGEFHGANGGNGGSGSTNGSNGTDGKTISFSDGYSSSIGVSSAAALKTAVDAGATSIQLAGNIELTDTLNITKGLTLDLNGYVLQYKNSAASGSVIKVESGGKLTLKDSRANDTTAKHYFTVDESTGLWSLCTATGCSHEHKTVTGGIITGGTGTAQTGDGITSYIGSGVYNTGTFNMTGGTITGCGSWPDDSTTTFINGGGVYNNGTFNMSGGSITGCTAHMGGGVYNYKDITMSGGTIENCTANFGGGVYNNGTFTISGTAKIENCNLKKIDGFAEGAAVCQNCGHYEEEGSPDNRSVTLNANGGTIRGSICNLEDSTKENAVITRTATNDDPSTYTTFDGEIENGDIQDEAKLTVTFNSNYEGSTTTTQKVWKGQKAAEPTAPTNGTYVFDGWYTAASGGTKFDFENTTITGHTTLYAQWVPTHAVTFDANGGTLGAGTTPSQRITHGKTVGEPAQAPTRTGDDADDYVFGGWYEKDGTAFKENKFDFSTAITGDITLYARWLKKIESLDITLTIDDVAQASVTNASVTYNGESHTVGFVIKDGDHELVKDKDYTLLAGSTTAATDVGSYEFQVSGKGSYAGAAAYSWTGGWQITKAPVTVKADDITVYVGDAMPTLTYTATGLIGSETLDGAVTLTCTAADTSTAGTYTITASAPYSTAGTIRNYSVTCVSGTLTVKNRPAVSLPVGSVSVSGSLNGSVSVDRDDARQGSIVTVTVNAANGYALDALTVVDANGNAVAVTHVGGNRYSFVMPATNVTVRATFTDGQSTGFIDVPADKYFYNAVNWAVASGITSGVDATHFSPYASCTRGQLVTFLWRAAGCPAAKASESPSSDVQENSAFYQAILWAAENGIVTGYADGTFQPNAAVSRQQTAAILYRYAKYAGMDVSAGEDSNILSFNDATSVSEYAVSAFQWATGAQVITGNAGSLLPYDTCTRAQIVTMLYRLLGK